jgi:hypothetical protein
MQDDELTDDHTAEIDDDAAHAGAGTGTVPPDCIDGSPEVARPDDGQPLAEPGNDDDPGDGPEADDGKGQDENRVQQRINETSAEVINGVSGNHNKFSSHVHYYADQSKDLAQFVMESPLQASKRVYNSLDHSNIDAYAGSMLTRRILLLGCYSDDVALNVSKCIAFESNAADKQLVTIDTNCEGAYTLKNLIQALARPHGNEGRKQRRGPRGAKTTVCVWVAHNISEGDISNTILDSLFIGNAQIEQYQNQLSSHGLCLICLVSPQKLEDYKRSRFNLNLQIWHMDFLRPLLEEYGLSQFEELAEAIVRQRKRGLWSADDAECYREIVKHLEVGKLPSVVAGKEQGELDDDTDVRQLFDREDPVVDTVLYCATYYPGLSPQEFSHLVQLFLGDADEEATKKTEQPRPEDGSAATGAADTLTLARRWEHESDAILRRCKLAAITDKNNKRVVDFIADGLRSRLRQHIRDEHYFFYEARFEQMRRLGLLFSPKKKLAEGARQLLMEMAQQYAPGEVADWLLSVVAEFEELAQAADRLRDRSQLFQLLPDARVKAARHYVCHGLSLVVSKLNKEPDSQDAARLFWQRLLQTQRHWFLDVLRQMGNSAPTETLSWLKHLLEQGSKEIRPQAHGYLLGYLLRRDSLVYAELKETMQWSPAGQAGRAMQTLFIVYCMETNRQVPQQDYGQWPSSHPLFGFQTRAEACDRLALLVGWLFDAAFEVDRDAALSVIADIVAGWYFSLLPLPGAEPAEDAAAESGDDELGAGSVRRLLLESLARHCTRAQRSSLLEIWEGFKGELLEEVFRLEEFSGRIAELSLDARLMTDTATARRKLLDTRALLSQLRKDFIGSAADAARG